MSDGVRKPLFDYPAIAEAIRRGGTVKLAIPPNMSANFVHNNFRALRAGLWTQGVKVNINVVDGFVFMSPREER